jgi:Protein of unknown function (DUF1360)
MNTAWMHSPLMLIIYALAAYRIERLLARDTFPPIAWMRDTLVDRLNRDRDIQQGEHWLADLVSCPWCLGLWVAIAVVVLASLLPWWIVVAVPLAFSAVIGHLAGREQ